jgi:hypothetical protein
LTKIATFILTFALILLIGSQMPTMAQAPAPAAKHASGKKTIKITGKVAAIDTSAETITIHNKKANADTVLTLTPATKILYDKNIGLDALTAGDKINVQSSSEIAKGAASIAANRITLISPLAEEKHKGGKHSLQGSIVSVSPLTISADDGSNVSVTTTDGTKVYETEPAKQSDILVGAHVQVIGKPNGTVINAVSLTIEPTKTGHKKA